MVDLTLPETNVQQQINRDETDREHHEEKRQNLNVDGKRAMASERSSKATQNLLLLPETPWCEEKQEHELQ